MILQELFEEYGYRRIEGDRNGESTGLSMNYFYDKEDRKPSELVGIYISRREDELFLVLNGEGQSVTDLCEKWDVMIRNFMIFGSRKIDKLQRLKYNVIQLILFQNDIKNRSEELSLNISRKIFLRCSVDETGNVVLASEEELEVPFYTIQSDDSDINQNLIDELKQYTPEHNPSLAFLNQERKKANKNSKSFSPEEYNVIKEWLTEHETNEG